MKVLPLLFLFILMLHAKHWSLPGFMYALDTNLLRLGSTNPKKNSLTLETKCFFIQKCSNLHERYGMFWIERKIKFQVFPIFFSSYGHFCDVSTPIFDEFFMITQKIKIRIFQIFFSFYSAHSASSIKTGLKLRREGVYISLVGKSPNLFLLLL